MQNKSDFFGPMFILGLAELKLGLCTHTCSILLHCCHTWLRIHFQNELMWASDPKTLFRVFIILM